MILEFEKIFEKLPQEKKDELLFKALGGKKKTSKYVVDTYYEGLGYYVGGWNSNEIEKVFNELEELGLPSETYNSLPVIRQAKEKYKVDYINTIMSGKANNPFIQFFVCNAQDVKF